MKILVTGARGQLGHDVCKEIGYDAVGIGIDALDITDKTATYKYIEHLCPKVIVHCAAYTAVDKAESDAELCYSVNALGTKYIAESARNIDAKIVYISTDYVFDGTLDHPYEIDDTPNPLNVYGRTKLEGEEFVRYILEKHFIIRTSWAFGANGHNFVKTMLRFGLEQSVVKVVTDQIGSPTYTSDLARFIADIILSDKFGTYHATNEGFCSWHEFACKIFEIAEMDVAVIPITTNEYSATAKRPRNSKLSKQCLTNAGFNLLPDWKSSLNRYIAGI